MITLAIVISVACLALGFWLGDGYGYARCQQDMCQLGDHPDDL